MFKLCDKILIRLEYEIFDLKDFVSFVFKYLKRKIINNFLEMF